MNDKLSEIKKDSEKNQMRYSVEKRLLENYKLFEI